ncbi:hypothetical protein ACIBCR_15630 [Micromonospora echinospora]|uniref:hypothetical protein n=1 Tax=Micromonospora echinospora TaxID=1877 RepID=UPI00379851AE
MTITLKSFGITLITIGALIGVVLAVKVEGGITNSAGFVLWATIGATVAICGTIVCVGDHVAKQFNGLYWRNLTADFRSESDNTGEVRYMADRTRGGRTAN